jgi:hypothetical protein
MGRKNKYSFSFSLSRLIGIQALKQSVARFTGIPTTILGIQRKIGAFILNLIFRK